MSQELHDVKQQLQLQKQRPQGSRSTDAADLNVSIVGDERSVLAFGSVDVNDLVLFYPVVALARHQMSQDATDDQATSTKDGVNAKKSHASEAARIART